MRVLVLFKGQCSLWWKTGAWVRCRGSRFRTSKWTDRCMLTDCKFRDEAMCLCRRLSLESQLSSIDSSSLQDVGGLCPANCWSSLFIILQSRRSLLSSTNIICTTIYAKWSYEDTFNVTLSSRLSKSWTFWGGGTFLTSCVKLSTARSTRWLKVLW